MKEGEEWDSDEEITQVAEEVLQDDEVEEGQLESDSDGDDAEDEDQTQESESTGQSHWDEAEDEDEDDEDEDDEDEEDEEDIDLGRAQKRPRFAQKKPVSAGSSRGFFEEEAEVEDDEEEDDEDEGDLDQYEGEIGDKDETEFADTAALRRGAFQRQLADDDELSSTLMRYAKEDDEVDYLEDFVDDEVGQEELMPSLRDPKLWFIRCKTGKERAVLHFMARRAFSYRNNRHKRLLIKSAYQPCGLKGYIYVEAFKEAHVDAAIEGVPHLNRWSKKLVPLNEMHLTLKVPKRKADLPKGHWVRIKRGAYKGDIGMVEEYDGMRGQAVIRLVPRVDIEAMTTPAQVDEDGKKKKRKRANRPDPKLFDIDMAHQLRLRVTQHPDGSFTWKTHRFSSDGFALRAMALKSLESEDVMPTLEDMEKFQTHSDPTDDDSSTATSTTTSNAKSAVGGRSLLSMLVPKKRRKFAKGDVVQVIKGDLKGLVATVHDVNGDDIQVVARDVKVNQLIPLKTSEVEKFFEIGQHVQVLSGVHQGDTGMIVRVDERVVVLFSDVTRTEIKALKSEVQKCSHVSTGRVQLGKFQLHDLVQLSPHEVGVIVKIERDGFNVLDGNGMIQKLAAGALSKRRSNRDAVAYDAQQNPINPGDLVKIVDGEYRGRQGAVMHLYRHIAFLKSRELLENGGIIAIRTSTCHVIGGSRKAPQAAGYGFGGAAPIGMVPQSPGALLKGASAMGAAMDPRQHSRFAHRRRARQDELWQKTVRITAGEWKGCLGYVKDCFDKTVRVELQANGKVVPIDREKVTLDVSERSQQSSVISDADHFEHGAAPGSRTPSRHYYDSLGSRTPGRDTPGAYGSRTPGRDTPGAYGSRTPGRDESDVAWDPQAAANTPAAVSTTPWLDNTRVSTPAASWTHNAATPALGAVAHAQTPVLGAGQTPVAPTPYFAEQWAGGNAAATPTPYIMAATTPSAGATPHTYDPAEGAYAASSATQNWLLVGVQVSLGAELTGDRRVAQGFVTSSDENGATVTTDTGREIRVGLADLHHVRPAPIAVGSNVMIIRGPQRGQIGTHISGSDNGVIVSVAGQQLLFAFDDVAPYH